MRYVHGLICGIAVILSGFQGLPVKAQTPDEGASDSVVTIRGQLPKKKKPVQTLEVRQSGNLRSLADQAGYDGAVDAQIVFVVPKDVVIMGAPDGGTALDTGTWPQGVTLGLAINGKVYGGGGRGGDGGPSPGPRNGTKGGDAIVVRSPMTIAVAEGGAVESGGGGGGGGSTSDGTAGGGGGGGFPNGPFGVGGMGNSGYADSGRPGRVEGGGQGGNNTGVGGSFAQYQLPPSRPTMLARPTYGGNGGMGGRPGDVGGADRGAGGGEPGLAIRADGNRVELYLSGRMRGETD
ncbi:hypothetical protein ABAC460_05430 [Asticcacaulis sp. AC460]|uniref:hypothetical protein n=1 Tax=Asticcacaulis sp. AC460 TaxID=1282360 RepID=UPI0003C3C6C0|nr:hypothetical protein [Asticcacaulis sp. AC460]ESQ91782.1 hypothetical protein ABAC460_05430 [Asticcacaulis sp. AC460]